MRRAVFLLTTAAALAAMLAFAGPALAQTDADVLAGAALAQTPDEFAAAALAQTTDDPLPTNDNPPVTVLQTELSGAEEVPPGDPDGSGSATIIVIPPDTICYVLTAEGIQPATAAHIHSGPPGVAGPVEVPLAAPTFGASGGCTQANPEDVSGIQENPGNYYVNVHNEEYPAGAIRGQL
jgi:hypothetical protein